jgi:hypothetical protein
MTHTINTPMSKADFLSGLTANQRANFIAHFDKIYVCEALTDGEENILYLAYLWKNGFVVEEPSGNKMLHTAVKDVTFEDFELSIEVPEGDEGGVNLDVTFEFYGVGELMEM